MIWGYRNVRRADRIGGLGLRAAGRLKPAALMVLVAAAGACASRQRMADELRRQGNVAGAECLEEGYDLPDASSVGKPSPWMDCVARKQIGGASRGRTVVGRAPHHPPTAEQAISDARRRKASREVAEAQKNDLDAAASALESIKHLPLSGARLWPLQQALSGVERAERQMETNPNPELKGRAQQLRSDIEKALPVAFALDAATPSEACTHAPQVLGCVGLALAILEDARQEPDDANARLALDRAEELVGLAGAQPRANGDADDALGRIRQEQVRREVSAFHGPGAFAVVEVRAEGSGSSSSWCAAQQRRAKLIKGGLAADHVLVSAKATGEGEGRLAVDVRAAADEELVVDADTACRGGAATGVRWKNPVREEQDRSLRAALNDLLSEIRGLIEKGELTVAKERIDALQDANAREAVELGAAWKKACREAAGRLAASRSHATMGAVLACASPLSEIETKLIQAGQPCTCADEFEARSCAERRKAVLAELKDPSFVLAEVGSNDIILGAYDFSAKRFPISIAGWLVEKRFEPVCAPQSCPSGGYDWELEPDQNVVRVGDGAAPLWHGTVLVPDVDSAKRFKDNTAQLKGQVLLVLRGVQVRSRTDSRAAAVQKQGIAKVKAWPPQRADEREQELACLRSARVAYQEVTAHAVAVAGQIALPSGAPNPLLEWPAIK